MQSQRGEDSLKNVLSFWLVVHFFLGYNKARYTTYRILRRGKMKSKSVKEKETEKAEAVKDDKGKLSSTKTSVKKATMAKSDTKDTTKKSDTKKTTAKSVTKKPTEKKAAEPKVKRPKKLKSIKERALESYQNRLNSYFDEMKWLYFELYRGDEEAFSYFLSLLEKYALSREEDLLLLDEQRMADPDWYKGKDQYGVLLYVNNFANNLKGVGEHLDYLKESGFNYLQLMPILESPKDKSDGGYAVSDFQKIQAEIGTMEDLVPYRRRVTEKELVSVWILS